MYGYRTLYRTFDSPSPLHTALPKRPSSAEHPPKTPNRTARRGRSKPPLSRELIADTTLRLIDAEGVGALTMRRLATELSVGTMTLYGYFRDKDELLDHAVDRAARRYDLSPGEGEWRPRMRELITTMWSSLTDHPSTVQIRSRKPILNPGTLRAAEAGATILRDAGFDTRQTAAAWRLLFTYVFGYAVFSSEEPTAEMQREWREQMSQLPADEYPITRAGAADFADSMAGRKPFEQGLELILDGLEARLAAGQG